MFTSKVQASNHFFIGGGGGGDLGCGPAMNLPRAQSHNVFGARRWQSHNKASARLSPCCLGADRKVP